MTGNPTNILFHNRMMMIEQIMALIGRASPNPKRYREILESFETATLSRTLKDLTEGNEENEETLFPAPEETTDDIQSAIRRTGASTPARDAFLTPDTSHLTPTV